jgi:hypothetical protein
MQHSCHASFAQQWPFTHAILQLLSLAAMPRLAHTNLFSCNVPRMQARHSGKAAVIGGDELQPSGLHSSIH